MVPIHAHFAEFFTPYRPHTVGFDQHFTTLDKINSASAPSFPKYNVYKKSEDSEEYYVDFAVAGYLEEDLKINIEGQELTVEGAISDKDDYIYQHQGIAKRSFRKVLYLEDNVYVEDAKLQSGILSIRLKRVVPEEQKLKEIKIN
jgi:molecular chaperone IbpA